MKKNLLIKLSLVFVVISVAAIGLSNYNPQFHLVTLLAANTIMFGISVVAGLLATSNIEDRPQAFVRGVFSGSFLKLFASIIAIGAYIFINRGHLYKPLVFCLLGIYLIYSLIETWAVSRSAR